MMYQMIALDMDGTLLNEKKEITPGNMKAIEEAVQQGKYVVLNTGRCLSELVRYLDIIPGLRFVNSVSGALVYDLQKKQAIYQQAMEPELICQLFEFAREEDAMPQILSEKSYVKRAHYEIMEQFQIAHFKPIYSYAATKLEDFEAEYRKNPFPVEKFNIYHRTVESREVTKRKIMMAGLPVEMAYAEFTSLEITACGVDKGVGLQKLSEHLGLSMEDVIVVGDSDNDIGALKVAGLAVAMGNAKGGIKRLADVQVADCEHDGCAEAIYKYLLAE